jgi:hypothetical protein
LRNSSGDGIFSRDFESNRLIPGQRWVFALSTLRKYQAFSIVAILAAPAGLASTWFVPSAWSNFSAITGIAVCVLCVFAMALLRCPHCRHQLGLSEAAREFQSHCCPYCGADLRS